MPALSGHNERPHYCGMRAPILLDMYFALDRRGGGTGGMSDLSRLMWKGGTAEIVGVGKQTGLNVSKTTILSFKLHRGYGRYTVALRK